jgi:hypothetical protein
MAMIIAIPKERRAAETRVAATPETVKKLKGLGFDIVVEAGAGEAAHFSDADYQGAGATIAADAATALKNADIVLKVRGPRFNRRHDGAPFLRPCSRPQPKRPRPARKPGQCLCHGVPVADFARPGDGRASKSISPATAVTTAATLAVPCP